MAVRVKMFDAVMCLLLHDSLPASEVIISGGDQTSWFSVNGRGTVRTVCCEELVKDSTLYPQIDSVVCARTGVTGR